MNKESNEFDRLLEDVRNGRYSRTKPTESGGYLIPVGSPYYGMSREQLDKVFNKQENTLMAYTSLNDYPSNVTNQMVSKLRDPNKTMLFYRNNKGVFAFEGNPDKVDTEKCVRNLFSPDALNNLTKKGNGAYILPVKMAIILHDDKKYMLQWENIGNCTHVCRDIWLDKGEDGFEEVTVLELPEDHPGTLFFVKEVISMSGSNTKD